MRFRNIDIIIAILIALVNVVFVQIPDRVLVLSIILALPLILIVPGYTLTQVLLHKRIANQALVKAGRPIGVADQLILSIGLSMAIAILVGFILNALPVGLQATSWSISLGLITTCLALVTVFLRRKDGISAMRTPGPRVAIHDYLLFGLAILVATGAIWASIIRPIQPQSSFTQFWMLPANQASKSCAVSIGIQSFETAPVTYYVVMTVNGVQENTWSPVSLSPHEQWTQVVTVKSGTAKSVSVQAQLYRTDNLSTVYRNVYLTFHVSTLKENGQVSQQCVLGRQ